MLEAACMNIAQWLTPEDGKILDLPFLGRLLQVELPAPSKPQLLETTPFDMNKLQPDTQVTNRVLSMSNGTYGRTRSWHRYRFEDYIIILRIF